MHLHVPEVPQYTPMSTSQHTYASLSQDLFFKDFEKINQPKLLDRLLISCIRSDIPELSAGILRQYNFQDLTKFEALRTAVECNKHAQFRMLLRNNVPICVTENKKTLSILHYIASVGDLNFLKILFEERKNDAEIAINCLAQSDKDVEGECAETPLSCALKSPSLQSADCVRFLIEKNALVNCANEDGTTPFMVALEKVRSVSTLKMLIDKGADVRDGVKPKTKLITLVSKNIGLDDKDRSECIGLLAQKKIDLNGVDDLNTTPLIWHTCSRRFHLSTKTLITFGVDVSFIENNILFKKNKRVKEEITRLVLIKDAIFQKIHNLLLLVFEYEHE